MKNETVLDAAERIRRVEAGETKMAVYETGLPATAGIAHHKDAWHVARFVLKLGINPFDDSDGMPLSPLASAASSAVAAGIEPDCRPGDDEPPEMRPCIDRKPPDRQSLIMIAAAMASMGKGGQASVIRDAHDKIQKISDIVSSCGEHVKSVHIDDLRYALGERP